MAATAVALSPRLITAARRGPSAMLQYTGGGAAASCRRAGRAMPEAARRRLAGTLAARAR